MIIYLHNSNGMELPTNWTSLTTTLNMVLLASQLTKLFQPTITVYTVLTARWAFIHLFVFAWFFFIRITRNLLLLFGFLELFIYQCLIQYSIFISNDLLSMRVFFSFLKHWRQRGDRIRDISIISSTL